MNQNPNFEFYSFSSPSPERAPDNAPEGSDNTVDVAPAKRSFHRLSLNLSFATLVWFALSFAVAFVAARFFPNVAANPLFALLSGTLPLYAAGIPLFYGTVRWMPTLRPERRSISGGEWIALLLIGFGLMLVGNYAGNIVVQFLSELLGRDLSSSLSVVLNAPLWANILITVVAAPILEELLFRKLLIDRMRPFGEKTAVLVSALMFGLFHANLQQLFYATALGWVLGYVYCRTGKLRHCVIFHMIINLFGGVLSTAVLSMIDYDQMTALLLEQNAEALMTFMLDHLSGFLLLIVYECVFFALAIAGIVLLFVRLRHTKWQDVPQQLPGSHARRAVFGNVGMIVFVVLCLVLLVVQTLP